MTNIKDKLKQEKAKPKGNKLVNESLMLSASSVGRTTSSSIAEKSVAWEENRLYEKKNKLDEKLYKNIVKINSDRLELVNELTKLQKCKSTGSLEQLERKHLHAADGSGHISPYPNHGHHSGHNSRRGSVEVSTALKGHKIKPLSPTQQPKLLHTESVPCKISITVGGDTSSEESGDEDKGVSGKHGRSKSPMSRTFSVTTCQLGRECGSVRNEMNKFENASRRYNIQFKAKNGK